MGTTAIVALVMLIGVVSLLVMGAPIAISIGGASVLSMLFIPSLRTLSSIMNTAAGRMFSGIDSFALLAIPFFILAGNLMNTGGIARRLIDSAKLLSGKLPGSLAATNTVANMLFGAISGSGVAAAAAIGGVMNPNEEAEGYDRAYSAAVNIASAPTGMLIPPSNTLIVYSTVAGSVSVSALFMAGYLPGILWGLLVMGLACYQGKKRGYVSNFHVSFKEGVQLSLRAIPALLLIVIVIGGILGGVFTATEGSAIAVVYSLVLGLLYRELHLKDLPKILLSSAKMTCVVIFLIGVSSIMSWVMSKTGIPELIANALLGFTNNKYVILMIMNIVLLVVGTFMDPTPAVLIFTPIFLPICIQFGMSPIHFGIMLVMNLCIGTITPPVGPILFTGCKVADISIEGVFKTLLPYFVLTAIALMLVTYIPAISMTIPNALGLIK